MIFLYGEEQRNNAGPARLYAEMYPQRRHPYRRISIYLDVVCGPKQQTAGALMWKKTLCVQ
jgi:hypothetical protein